MVISPSQVAIPLIGQKKIVASNKHIFDILLVFKFENFLTFLKNYLAKSEIMGLTERNTISYANLPCASGYALRFEKSMALEMSSEDLKSE